MTTVLGEGAQGIVTLVKQGDNQVVVKTFKKKTAAAIQNEVKCQEIAAADGLAPRILATTANSITMEYFLAETMLDYLRKRPMPPDLQRRVVETWERLIAAGINHGDMDFRNILITATGDVKIIDFGKSSKGRPSIPSQLAFGMAINRTRSVCRNLSWIVEWVRKDDKAKMLVVGL